MVPNGRLLRRCFREHTIGRYGPHRHRLGPPGLRAQGREEWDPDILRPGHAPARGKEARPRHHRGPHCRPGAVAGRRAIAAAEANLTQRAPFAEYVEEFVRRQARRLKPSTRTSNRHLVERYLVPFFGTMPVVAITRADVRSWFDSLSGTPGTANRTLPVFSVMMRQAELREMRPQGSNPYRGMRRYRLPPRERFLSADEKRLGFVLDHAGDRQAAAAIRLLLFTGARPAEITGLRWDWIRGTRAVLRYSKTGPKAIQLPPPARNVLDCLPRLPRTPS